MNPDFGVHMTPGAVPVRLGIILAPSGSNACLRLICAILRPFEINFLWISSQISGLSLRGVSKAAAIVSIVISSGVGPRPPVVISI